MAKEINLPKEITAKTIGKIVKSQDEKGMPFKEGELEITPPGNKKAEKVTIFLYSRDVELIKKFNKLRKHKLTIIATTISESVLDKAAMDNDLLDAIFRRPFFNDTNPQKCKIAYYRNLLNGRKLKLMGIPATSVHFDSWDASPFSEKPLEQKRAFNDKDMELVYRWAKGETYAQLGVHPQQLTRAKKKIIPILIDSYLHASHNKVRG